ncbi:MAG: bifunctional allantoicase/(S)-ureidoglycine aminohydrolase [Pseudomonadota bacterium]
MHDYANPPGGLPPQTALMTGRAVFNAAYALIPGGTMRDITASRFPHYDRTRGWIIARPMTGFAETFSHYIMETEPGGGSPAPEPDPSAEAALFVTGGTLDVQIGGQSHSLGPGGFAYVPPGSAWTLANPHEAIARYHLIRKRYQPADGLAPPDPVVARDADIAPIAMPDTEGRWATTRFMDPDDMRHDMAITIVTLQPGGVIPFEETHVMEHGLYVLQGKGVYKLNTDWHEVEAGDYMWLRAFCPQACYAGGDVPFRYLLYKDVNRHPSLRPGA